MSFGHQTYRTDIMSRDGYYEISLDGLDKGITLGWSSEKRKSGKCEYSPIGIMAHNLKYAMFGDSAGTPVYSANGRRKYLSHSERMDLVNHEIAPRMVNALKAANVTSKNLVVIPVPSYCSERDRWKHYQYSIAKSVATGLGLSSCYFYLKKNSPTQAKENTFHEWPEGVFVKKSMFKPEGGVRDILLVDDMFGTGKTVSACVKELRKDPSVGKIFFISLAATRTGESHK